MKTLLHSVGIFLLASAAFAQSDRGTITGTLSDPAGAVIASGAIEAKNTGTGAVYQTVSSGTGNYTIAQLPAGTYDVSVTVPGFKKYVREGLQVEVAANMRIDIALEVGSNTESITVEAAATLLKTEGGEISHNVTTETLDELPILTLTGAAASIGTGNSLGNIRNPLSAVQLLPGARISTDAILRVNGMPSNSQSINIEGQDATNGFFKQQNQVNQAGMEAIQEVAIQTSNFAAEYGQAGGGYFNYTMKSGANQLHGSGYDYFVNEVLNAGTPFTNAGILNPSKAGQLIRNPIRQNDYGVTFGGPIVIPKLYNGHDKTFFFFSFEQFRQSAQTSNTYGIVPTVAQRNGDFSAALLSTCNNDPNGQPVCQNEIFDPTTNHTVNGIVERNPFPNNKIPASMIDPTAAIIQNMIPLPNTPGLFNYTAPEYSNFRHTTIPSIKIDELLSQKMKLSGYYSATKTFSPQNNGFTEPYTALQPQNALAQTIRLNLDVTLTPTLLLHLGAGYLHTSNPQTAPTYDQKALFPDGIPFTASNFFPYMAGMYSTNGGGWSGGGGFPGVTNTGVAFTLTPEANDYKPTFNANLTWVKGNHTYKLGATALFEGIQSINDSRADGQFAFAQQQTADPSQNGQPFANIASSGFGYASFFLGATNSVSTAAPADVRLGTHSYGIYVQDSWKVTRKLTFDYGLRWDYAILWKEQYGRMQNADFTAPNSLIGGRLGTVEYQATCKCNYANAYPFAIGPHLGVAYQITPKTVFRAGGAITYAAESDQAGLNSSAGDFYTIPAAAYGASAGRLQFGDPLGPGNPYGNPVVHWPNFNPQYPVPAAPGVIPPSSPFVSIAPNTGRLPRIFQWSIGFQREITKDLVVDAAYVGNRGAWWVSPLLGSLNYNALTPQQLAKDGIDITNRADATLLNTQINSPAVIARFPYLANPNNVYPGFPATQTLLQALRPYPQWIGIPPFLGPPDGNTWYDSLQIKATKRYSHGLSAQVAYTWQKELTNGTNSNTSYVTPSPPLINDVYNKSLDKQISGFSVPQELIIAFNYTTPKAELNFNGGKAVSWLARDWTLGAVLRYQSGTILQTPFSSQNLLANLGRGPTNNPALWGGGYTFMNRVPGQPLFLVNPNSKFDPTKQLALNPNAWVEPAFGTFGASAPYFNDFRWQRQPAESMAFGRVFRIKERAQLQIRAEFQNIFNRLFYQAPADGQPFGSPFTSTNTTTLHGNPGGALSQGFGYVNFVNGGLTQYGGAQPRSGQLVARFTF
ncbi:MAG TPA: carboxypeptidase regulatory-like domain-containing protein [Bryobacteraceae bacterium]|nr:carboxypeptidase regulatory-like domain-containing protein [Bryobacteraceae bacterium]